MIFNSCLDKIDKNEEETTNFFAYHYVIPCYFYDSLGNNLIDIKDYQTYPISYVKDYSIPSVTNYTLKGFILSNYDGIDYDNNGDCYWYSFIKGCYDSTSFQYFVKTKYLTDTINVKFIYDTIQDAINFSVKELKYNGVTIMANQEDTINFYSAHHVNIIKYPNKTIVNPQ